MIGAATVAMELARAEAAAWGASPRPADDATTAEAAGAARPAEVVASSRSFGVDAALGTVQNFASGLVDSGWFAQVSGDFQWRFVAFGVGLRLALADSDGTVRPEVFGRVSLAPRFGVYAPTIGPELGYSDIARRDLSKSEYLIPGEDIVYDEISGPLFVTLHAAPLRFHVGAWRLSFLELGVGSAFPRFGRTTRFDVTIAQGGWCF